MRFVSFNALRTLGLPGVLYLKPDQLFAARDAIAAADVVLFPETWQVNALVYGMRKSIFPSLPSYHLGRDKVEMTRAFESLVPEHVPRTVIAPATPEGVERALDELGLPLVVKDPRSARGCGVHRVGSRAELRRWADAADVLYAQELLDVDRDLRVVWVGDRVVAAYWRVGGDGFRRNVAQGGELDFTGVPSAALELVARVATHLGVDHAGFDLVVTGERLLFLELNVLFGNQGLLAAGIDVAGPIGDFLARRYGPPPNPLSGLPRAS